MNNRIARRISVLVVCLATVAAIVAVARGQLESRPPVTEIEGGAEPIWLPAVQVVNVGNAVLRVETATGRVSTLEGNPQNLGVANTWKQRVPPVEQENSGRLRFRLSRYGNLVAVLLLDVDRGDTWILKHRGDYDGFWEPIQLVD